VIFALMGLYLLGKLKFSHDSTIEYVSVPRLILAIMAFAFAVYMVPGLWGAPTRLLSGLAPPSDYTEGAMYSGGNESNNSPNIAEEDKPKKYTSLFRPPHGINTFFDYEEALAMAKKKGKPLMIDFTGLACVNCRRMEDNVWVDPKVLEKLKNDYVLVQLYVDDKTELVDKEIYTSVFSGKKINTIGKKWSDLQATRYKANSQPFYVLLDHSENLLAQPRGYDPDINDFAGFLEEGINKFKAQANK
jgi:thiol:disulfide interchange protein DsbD